LKPSFFDPASVSGFPEITWSITPGNSSPLTDGASAALITSEERAKALGLKPRARFHTFTVTGADPILMLTGIIPATQKALKRSGLSDRPTSTRTRSTRRSRRCLAWLAEFDADRQAQPRGGRCTRSRARRFGTRLSPRW
jgi:acetyl-CoA acyltransferase